MTLQRLPMLAPHEHALERCVYCPKLSRAACPVSTVEHSETVTPWGKMSMAYFAARGDVPLDAAHAEPAWACSGCFACRELCDHKNEVATVLGDARAELFAAGVAPEAATRVASGYQARAAETARAVDALAGGHEDGVPLLIGCGYLRHAPAVARDALEATATLLGRPVRPLRGCCGLPLLHAGDRRGFVEAAKALRAELRGAREMVAVDPGCARALLVDYPRVGVGLAPPATGAATAATLAWRAARLRRSGRSKGGASASQGTSVTLFVDLAARSAARLRPLPGGAPMRFHDPCQLGRGLGRYDEPRALLERLGGAAPGGFLREREHGECSGGGGLLPVTRPASSAAIADARVAEHRQRGGGLLVTHCAQSLHRFRTRGEPAEDLVSLVARALEG